MDTDSPDASCLHPHSVSEGSHQVEYSSLSATSSGACEPSTTETPLLPPSSFAPSPLLPPSSFFPSPLPPPSSHPPSALFPPTSYSPTPTDIQMRDELKKRERTSAAYRNMLVGEFRPFLLNCALSSPFLFLFLPFLPPFLPPPSLPPLSLHPTLTCGRNFVKSCLRGRKGRRF